MLAARLGFHDRLRPVHQRLAHLPVNQKIRTLLMFNLSAGDRVTFNADFTVEPAPVPLPAGAWLFFSALGSLVARRSFRAKTC